MRTSTIRHTQASTEIMRISHTIQQQQKWRALNHVQQLGEVARQREFARTGYNALMTPRTHHGIEALIICLDHTHIDAFCGAQQITHATIMAR